MRDLEKYRGIIPAFYACYEDDGSVSAERTQALTQHLIDKNVKGVYVCGSSGECILSEQRGTQAHSGKCDEDCKRQNYRNRPCTATIRQTARSLQLTQKALELMPSLLSRLLFPSSGSCRSRSTGMISAAQLQIQTLLFTISRSLQVWR